MKTLLASSTLALFAMAGAAAAQDATSACLITKTDTNPFFVKMREGAEAKAEELGIALSNYAGSVDGDHESQVQAIETCIANSVSGILLAASDPAAVVSSVQAARDAGILVIALDTPLIPVDAADATFATDNFQTGLLIGQWAAATLREEAANVRIAFLDLLISQPTTDLLRDQGFMTGFGIDTIDSTVIGDETDPRIVGHDVTQGNEEGGRTAMENLLAVDPDIDVVYTINEPSAAGAYEALRAVGRDDEVMIVSVDGGCPGVQNVAEGALGATSQQYPLQMAALGIEAIAQYAADGIPPEPAEGKDFTDTGVALITDGSVEGMEAISSAEGLELCWGLSHPWLRVRAAEPKRRQLRRFAPAAVLDHRNG